MHIIENNDLSVCGSSDAYFLLYFTASWCKPCQHIKASIIDLDQKSDDQSLQVCMIDINENDELSDHFEIESVPTFITLKNNNMLKRATGASLNVVINLLRESFKSD